MAPHPLPPRPAPATLPRNTSSNPSAASGASSGLALPARSPFFNTPQPASPRTPGSYTPYQSGSPKVGGGGGGVAAATLAAEEVPTWTRKAFEKEELRPNTELLELGEGWEVHWRSWAGPPLLSSSSSASLTPHLRASHAKFPSSSSSSTSSSRTPDVPPAKRPRLSAFDEILAEDDGVRLPIASTSRSPSLKEKLQALGSVPLSSDPIEEARRQVLEVGRSLEAAGQLSGLFSFVQVSAEKGEDRKGKGKETEDGEDTWLGRTLWVFCIGKEDASVTTEDACAFPARQALLSLEFGHLTSTSSGSFTHQTLFPALYPPTPAAPSASPASYTPISSLPVSAFPSVLDLSSALHADPSSDSSPSRSHAAAYHAFLSGATESILLFLLADSQPPSSVVPRSNPTTRLGGSIVVLPPASTPFGTSGRRIVPCAVKGSFHLSLHRNGIFVQSTIADIALRPYPLDLAPPVDSPLRLAPFDASATFVKAYPAGAFCSTRDNWRDMLEGTGVALAEEEVWIVCRVALPSPSPATANTPPFELADESIEVAWPASLCLLDGTRPQPQRSPISSPRGKPTDLSASTSSSTTPPSRSRGLALPPVDIVTRRRFASILRRQQPSEAYRDPISSRAEKVGKMLVDMADELEKQELAEREADEAALARAKAPPPPAMPPTPVEQLKHSTLPPTTMAGAPINMRTPISLGGTSTEAPSPADGFPVERGGVLGGYLAQMGPETRQAEVDHLYPSPPELHNSQGMRLSQGGGEPMQVVEDKFDLAPIDNAYVDGFDWGEDFASGGMRNHLPQDFDDGMMMGLTDDDFSFFDDPTPLPPSSLPPFHSNAHHTGLQSSGPSPKFVDHFSHLTPFASAVSPTSPFGASPHLLQQGSPNLLLGFPFEPPHLGGNALGLGGTPGSLHMEGSPFKTPRTPYSPFVELADEQQDPYHPPTLSIGATPAVGAQRLFRRASAFDPVPFGTSHALSDDKYDPRKGKFGLPSPDAEVDELDAPVSSSRRQLADKAWYTTVCDPRVTAAGELKRRRKPSGAKLELERTERGKPVRARTWVRNEVESDAGMGEEESEDDWMEVDKETPQRGEDDAAESEEGWRAELPFGAALLLLRQHLPTVFSPSSAAVKVPAVVTKAMLSADAALEATATLLIEGFIYNPDSRAGIQDVLLAKPTTPCPHLSISSHAIQVLSERLSVLKVATASSPSLLTTQTPPTILLRAQQSIMQLSTAAIKFWRPMAFEPLAGPKDVTAIVVYEDGGAELSGAVKGWLKRVTDAYQASRLGKHVPASVGAIQDGLAVIPPGSLSHPRARDDFKPLCSLVAEAVKMSKHVVVYLLTPPGPLPTSPSSPIALTIQQLLRTKTASTSVLVYPLPLSTIADFRAIGVDQSSVNRLDRLSFAVYDQLFISVAKLHTPIPDTFPSASITPLSGLTDRFQSPAITLSPARRTQIEFELQWPPSSLEVLHRHRILHVGYTSMTAVPGEPGLEWIVAVCIDEKGETWRSIPKLVRIPAGAAGDMARVRVVWSIARSVAEKADVEWRIVVCRLGCIPMAEIKAWDALLKVQLGASKRPLHVTITSSDLHPPLSILQLPQDERPAGLLRRLSAEEGELSSTSPSLLISKPSHLDIQPCLFAFTPDEPIALGSASDIIAPSSTYLIHLPRLASLAHTSLDAPSSESSISIFGLHLLLSHSTPLSSLSISLAQHTIDVGQSFVELAALGRVRWGSSGRVAWHLEAVGQMLELFKEVGG